MLKRLLGVLVTLAVFGAAAWGELTISVNAQDGATIAGEYKFEVKVKSNHLVTQVEFYIGDDLRDTDESTPYEFVLDTLAEKEGELKVTFAAYTNEGESAKKNLTLKIDNGLGKGLDAFLQQGRDALSDSKWDDAIKAGRVALKIKPGDNAARLIMARANLGKGVLDGAQKFTEDVVADDANNREALELLAGINLRRAFLTVNTATDPTNALINVKGAIESAVSSRRKSVDGQVDGFGPVTDANRMQYVDLLLTAKRYSLVVDQLSPLFAKDQRNNDVANRLIYALIRAGRFQDAQTKLRETERLGAPDGYGYALKAMLLQYFGDKKGSMEAEKQAILDDPGNLGVRSAQTYLALIRNDLPTLRDQVTNLAREAGQRTETNYYLSAARYMLGNSQESTEAMQTSLLAEPLNYDMFVEAGNQALWRSHKKGVSQKEIELQRGMARQFFEAALIAKPESFEALTGLALTRAYLGDKADAVRLGQAATVAGKEYSSAFYILAAILETNGRIDDARKVMRTAEKLDPANLSGHMVPNLDTAWVYFLRDGRMPCVPPPSTAH